MSQYRKKPVVITAEQYVEYGKLVRGMCNSIACYTSGNNKPHVHTIHDNQIVILEVGDFIIPEPDGEHFYPCKPDIFAATYEPADGTPAPVSRDKVAEAEALANVCQRARHSSASALDRDNALHDAAKMLRALAQPAAGVGLPDDLRKAAYYASDGPWEFDSEWNENGAYGGGPNHGTGYDDFLILDAQGRTLFGSENSTAKMIEEECDEDGGTAWDQAAKRNAAFVVASVNFVRSLLAAAPESAS